MEEALCLCNEIVFPGLLTGRAECFVPDDASSPYGGIESFGGRKFIYVGSSTINLNVPFPCFFDVPDLDNHNISRGNDVFLSMAYGRGAKLKEAENRYFHDPNLFSRKSDPSIDCSREPVDFFDWKRFFSLINA